MKKRFEINMEVRVNSFQLISINFSVLLTVINLSIKKRFEKLSRDSYFEKLKTILEF